MSFKKDDIVLGQCPVCGGQLDYDEVCIPQGNELWNDSAHCNNCGTIVNEVYRRVITKVEIYCDEAEEIVDME